MIRINLAPTKRKRAAATASPVGGRVQSAVAGGNSGAITFLLMFVGWLGLAGAGWYLLTIEDDAAMKVRTQTAGVAKEVGEIKAVIDEAGLKAREEEIKRQEVAIEKLKAKQRTPVFVMYELAMILTDAAAGGAVTIDEEKYKKNKADDPQSEINPRWDPSGLWLSSVVESEGRLAIEGSARDAADLAEFTRRLRASVWFGEITHPNYERSDANQRGREDTQRHLTWKIDVAVRRWN